MGDYANPEARGNYYLRTTATKPYYIEEDALADRMETLESSEEEEEEDSEDFDSFLKDFRASQIEEEESEDKADSVCTVGESSGLSEIACLIIHFVSNFL